MGRTSPSAFGLQAELLKDACSARTARYRMVAMTPRKLSFIVAAFLGLSQPGFSQTAREIQRGQTKELQQMISRANGGDATAQYNLGMRYGAGTGVPKDYAEAARWLRKAADQGLARAQFNLGMLYANGQGVTKDAAEAATWVSKAAESGDAAAQTTMGIMYATGQGVKQDDSEAAKWYRKAIDAYRKVADEGDPSAATALGNMYARGQGVTGDYSEAAGWWRKAADTGYAGAQYNLGLAYAQGRGVLEDDIAAYMWLSLSAAGAGEAQERRAKARDDVASKLKPDQLAEAQRLVREWKPKSQPQQPREAK